MILVTFAVPFESAAFRRTEAAKRVHILHTGVGEEAARVAMELAVCESIPDLVIASGFAGALTSDLQMADLVREDAPDEVSVGKSGRFASADAVLSTVEARRAFREITGADAVEMEGRGIRRVCDLAKVPMMTFRAISDTGDIGFPSEELEQLARQPFRRALPLGISLLRDGRRRKAFIQLLRDCKQAQTALGQGLVNLLAQIEH